MLNFSDLNNDGVIDKNNEVIQQTSYYPFGLDMYGLNTVQIGPVNKFKFNGKELQDDFGLNLYDFSARGLDPVLGRWGQVDEHADKYVNWSPYVYVYDDPIKHIDPDGKDGVVIVFPDYKIATPVGKIGGLGHAGVLLIDNKTGHTKYYEYGRYDKEGKGIVRSIGVSNVTMDKNGKPTVESLNKVMEQISDKAGHGTKIEGAYVKSDKFKEMNNYAEEKLKENSDSKREGYNLLTNNCGTFATDVVKQDEKVAKEAPITIDPRPNSIIENYQEQYPDVKYNPQTNKTTVEDEKKRKQNK